MYKKAVQVMASRDTEDFTKPDDNQASQGGENTNEVSEEKYLIYWYTLGVEENLVFLESGNGRTVDGNMFALLNEIEFNEEWATLTPIFVTTDETSQLFSVKKWSHGFRRVVEVRKGSDAYYRYLATAKYIFTDSTLPTIFCKKPTQILTNTWHGTPLKKMGRTYLQGARGFGNVQRVMFMSDYLLFPNEFTRKVFMRDYMLENQFHGRAVMIDYPRNDALHKQEVREEIQKKYGFTDRQQIIAYMPTWRGTDRVHIDYTKEVETVKQHLQKIDQKLSGNQRIYVKLHPFLQTHLEVEEFRQITTFPQEYETYEFLSATDILITDYSSVLFDYAGTGRKVILYAYDESDYAEKRGLYRSITDLPFSTAGDTDGVIKLLTTPNKLDENFLKNYCNTRVPGTDASTQLLRLVIQGKQSGISLYTKSRERPTHLIVARHLRETARERLFSPIQCRKRIGIQHICVLSEEKDGIKISCI